MTDINQLRIDDDFMKCLPPLSDEEYGELEKDIMKNGILSPVIIWTGIIVDGHNRYEICKTHGIQEIPTREMKFGSKDEALAWIYQNQLGRRNLTDNDRRYLLGKLYEQRKKLNVGGNGSNQYTKKQNNGVEEQWSQNGAIAKGDTSNGKPQNRTRDVLAAEQGVSKNTIARAGDYAKGIDIGEAVSPGFKDDVLSGKVKTTAETVQSIPKLSEDKQKDTVEKIRSGEYGKDKYKCKECGKLLPASDFFPGNKKVCMKCLNKKGVDRDIHGNKLSIRPDLKALSDAEVIGNLYGDQYTVEYTVEDLAEEIAAAADSFLKSVENSLEFHKDLTKETEDRNIILEPVRQLIIDAQKMLNRYI